MARTYWTDERLDGAFGELRQEMRDLRGDVRSEIGGLRTEMHTEMGALRADIHRDLSDLRRQALAAAVAIIVALIGVIGAILVSS